MEYRRLGRSGIKVSALSYGSWVTFSNQVDTRLAQKMLKIAYDQGVNFFDNAEAYANGMSETIMGQALRRLGFRRDSYLVSSKVFFGSVEGPGPLQRGLHRKHVLEACHQALERLQVDYLDLYFCHRPDPETPILETVRAMHDLITQGKVLYWGTSEWSAREIEEAYQVADEWRLIGPTMEQPQYNLFVRERMESEYASLFRNHSLGTTIWSPLASGILTGKYNQGIPAGSRLSLDRMSWLKDRLVDKEGQRRLEKTARLTQLAADAGISMTHLALAWCLKNPHVSTVILGASRPEQLSDNLEAIQALDKLDDRMMRSIDGILND
ncbi:MAG: aldo/keto reductase [Leptospiraceae bacterium]|nr:aldo/keto reductase [Leptospiraceae bacterium]